MRAAFSTDAADGVGVARNARLYDRLERALIALQYALGDARAYEQAAASPEPERIARSQDALQVAGEEVQDILLALKAAALERAAQRARQWS
jgi:D-serine dehydratase